MKTKELIRQLQEEDPTGESECCVHNKDILFVSSEPAYYDGTLQVLVRDENLPHYNVVGAKYQRDGIKIQIHSFGVEDAIADSNDPMTFPVTFEGWRDADGPDHYRKIVEAWRKETVEEHAAGQRMAEEWKSKQIAPEQPPGAP